ncbi:MAG: hypothetical protein JSR36_09545 [Proteobacteria bacterium]|nr:hypothetical protein [Pseudomonadota bacterium]
MTITTHDTGRRAQVTLGVLLSVLALAAGGDLKAAANTTKAASQKSKAGPAHASRAAEAGMPSSARTLYASIYGVDGMSAELAESGQLVRFSYRVVDPALAKPFFDKLSNPTMLDERASAVLSVPNMEKVGPLRQGGSVDAGKVYWVLFSNRGQVVKPGDRVSVVIGSRRVDGLIVQH